MGDHDSYFNVKKRTHFDGAVGFLQHLVESGWVRALILARRNLVESWTLSSEGKRLCYWTLTGNSPSHDFPLLAFPLMSCLIPAVLIFNLLCRSFLASSIWSPEHLGRSLTS